MSAEVTRKGIAMMLSDKITSLRKRNGWSQEELANQLGVSRQSVSKWESTASMPDINKIMRMSELFGVSTDYLLRDDMEQPPQTEQPVPMSSSTTDDDARHISLDEATAILDAFRQAGRRMGFAVSLLVASPIALIAFAYQARKGDIQEGVAVAIGLAVLLVMVAVGVSALIITSSTTRRYRHLEDEQLVLDYGVEAAVVRRRDAREGVHHIQVAIGVALCILGVVPLIAASVLHIEPLTIAATCLLFVMVAVAVYLFVSDGMVWSSYQKLLQDEDYSPENKRARKRLAWLSPTYWGVVITIYLGWSFVTMRWDLTWIVWPVAAVLFAAVFNVAKIITNRMTSR